MAAAVRCLDWIWPLGRQRLATAILFLLTAVLLTGCLDSDVAVRFDNPNRGEFAQHIQLRDRLGSGQSVSQWFNLIERQGKRLGGRVERSGQDLRVTIPFDNGADLERKFNQFFNRSFQAEGASAQLAAELPTVTSHLELKQNNFLLLERNRLHYDLDLRSLGLTSSTGTVLLSPAGLLDLTFSLQAPWGARSLPKPDILQPNQTSNGQLIWQLKPGEMNQIEAVFWMPNPLGIGTVVIVGLVLAGSYLKAQQKPQPPSTETSAIS